MKKAIVLITILASSAGWAQAPTTGGTTNDANGGDPNQQICQAVSETGSRLGHARICMTRAQWAEQRRSTRQGVERQQTTRVERQY
jgi:hypothetical protein